MKKKEQRRILLLNGPNLNLLGKRNPDVYGKETLSDITKKVSLKAKESDYFIEGWHTNYEGKLIDLIQTAPAKGVKGIILNAGGLTHTSVCLRDAVDFAREQGVPTIEVHISNIHIRETFRHVSLLTGVCIRQVSGMGTKGYLEALRELIVHLELESLNVNNKL